MYRDADQKIPLFIRLDSVLLVATSEIVSVFKSDKNEELPYELTAKTKMWYISKEADEYLMRMLPGFGL